MNYYLSAWGKYATFSGRARLAEYWYFFLFNIIAVIILVIIDNLIGTSNNSAPGLLTSLYLLAYIIPSLAVGVRRLHDINRSGWWLFIGFIPLVGSIILLVFLLQNSQPGPNQYGQNPKNENVGQEKYCVECGSKLDAGSKFCHKCGKKQV